MIGMKDGFIVAIERQRIIKTVIFVAASGYLRNNPPAVFSQPEES
jgi:hypothetical protein